MTARSRRPRDDRDRDARRHPRRPLGPVGRYTSWDVARSPTHDPAGATRPADTLVDVVREVVDGE